MYKKYMRKTSGNYVFIYYHFFLLLKRISTVSTETVQLLNNFTYQILEKLEQNENEI